MRHLRPPGDALLPLLELIDDQLTHRAFAADDDLKEEGRRPCPNPHQSAGRAHRLYLTGPTWMSSTGEV